MKKKHFVLMFVLVCILSCTLVLAACIKRTPDEGSGGSQGGTTYTVTFETVGGTAIAPVKVGAGKTVAKPANPTKAGADFIDWYTSSTYEGSPYNFSTPVNADLTLYAQWSDVDYAVVFDVDGGSPVIDYKTYKYGTKLPAPTTPTRIGYKFTGWYTDVACTQVATFPYEVKKNTQFYAGWASDRDVVVRFKIAERRTSAFDLNYDQEILAPMTIKAGDKLTQPQNPRDLSYLSSDNKEHTLKFAYWNFDPMYDGNYSDAVLFPIRKTNVEEIMLYAVYVEVKETETYASLTVHPGNGEQNTIMYGVMGKHLEISNLNEHDPMPFYSDKLNPLRTGYEVTGFFKTPNYEVGSVYEVPFLLENENNDVYLRWEEKDDLTVTFDYSFDSIPDKTDTFEYRGHIQKPENIEHAGYTFDGWYTILQSAVEERRWNFDTDIASRDITLYAKWVKTATIITYDTCGGYQRNPVSVSKDREILTLPVPVRQTGNTVYNFLGWYYDSNYTNAVTFPMTVSKDVTIYAKWSDAIDISNFDILDLGGSYGYSIRVKETAKADISGSITIPARYAGEGIERIENNAFKNCTQVAEVIVPDTVGYLYARVFEGCTSLQKVVLPASLYQISSSVFKGCSNLSEVNFPGARLLSIYADIFKDCPLMHGKLEQDAGGNYYWGTAFLGKTYFVTGEKVTDTTTTEVNVREGTTIMATYSLWYMNALETVTLADSVKYMPFRIFEDNSPLKTINLSTSFAEVPSLGTTLPMNIETINLPQSNKEFKMVDDCLIRIADNKLIASTINATTIPEGVVIIGEKSFRNKPLDTVVIPNSVTTIMEEAFAKSQFTNIVIPDSVGILDSSAFSNCSEMLTIKFGAKVNLQNNEIFSSMKKLKAIDVSESNPYIFSLTNVLYRKDTITPIHFAPKYSGAVTIADGTKELPKGIFSSTYIESLTIPDSVTTIADNAFGGSGVKVDTLVLGKNIPEITMKFGELTCNNNIEISSENPYMTAVDGVLYNKDITKLVLFPSARESYVFPDTIMQVSDTAYMPNLKDVTIGAGISREVFESIVYGNEENEYQSLNYFAPSSVKISAKNNDLIVFENVVWSKNKQQLIYIPVGFDGDFVLPKEVEFFDQLISAYTSVDATFLDEYKLNIQTLRVEEGSKLRVIDVYNFTNPDNWVSYTETNIDHRIPAWVESDYYSWRQAKTMAIHNVDLSNATKLENVGDRAFERLEELTTVKLPDKEHTLGFCAFSNCSSLSQVVGIGKASMNKTFAFCPLLVDENGFLIADGVFVSYESFFDTLSRGGDIVIPDNVTKIASNAFVYVEMRSIRIPSTVQTVCQGAINSFADMVIYIDGENTVLEDGWLVENDHEITVIKNGVSESGIYYYVEPTTGLYYKLNSNDNTAKLVDDKTSTAAWTGNVELGDVEYNGQTYILTEIGESALEKQGSGDITGIQLPNTLVKIGKYAFNDIGAEEVIIPDSVVSMDGYVFANNKTIKRVTLSQNITAIPNNTFYQCSSLESVVCGNITQIGNNAFSKCALLSDFDFSSVEVIGDYAFQQCAKLTNCDLPKAKTIGSLAFDECGELETITLNEGLMSIGDSAFRETGIKEVVIPTTVEQIGAAAFDKCAALATLTLNEGLTTIGNYAFRGTAIKELTIPASVTGVGDGAFAGCNALTTLTVKCSVGGTGVFKNSAALNTVNFVGGKEYSIGTQAFYQCNLLTTVTFGDGLTSIGNEAFRETAITTLSFPATLRTIGDHAFYPVVENKIAKPTITSITFEEGVTGIGQYSFAYAAITTLHLPASLTVYGDGAFYACGSLKQITFADGATKVGGKNVFQCKALEKVEFGSSEGLIIGVQSFYGANKLNEVIFADDCIVKKIDNYAFGITALNGFVLPEVEIMGYRVFYQCTAITITVPYAQDSIPAGWNAQWNTVADAKVNYME